MDKQPIKELHNNICMNQAIKLKEDSKRICYSLTSPQKT